MTREVGSLNPNDWLFLDRFGSNTIYSVACIGTSGQVTIVHECPDGRVILDDLNPQEEVEPAGERLMDLRGRRDDLDRDIAAATVRINRQGANPTRREIDAMQRRRWRCERVEVQAQIDELEDLGVVAGFHLGTEPRSEDELRAEAS